MLWSVAYRGDTYTPSMPFWFCQYTGGVLPSGAIFCPCGDTSHTGPIFSVTSIRPSGRKAIRHGSPNVVTVVIVNGRLESAFPSPTLTWAHPWADARVSSNAILAKRIVDSCLT